MIPSFHAHIYYTPSTREIAAEVREELGRRFQVQLGRWHDQPVGPHPESMYQVAFQGDQFNTLTQWLMLNRRGLTVFLHPETGDALADHRDHAIWMGRMLKLDISALTALDGQHRTIARVWQSLSWPPRISGRTVRADHEHMREGVCNLWMFAEPLAGGRTQRNTRQIGVDRHLATDDARTRLKYFYPEVPA